ncbi:filamentous hemagglutinin N-terminal domain-containing protein, partial [Salmonella enterica subsp. enterica serovar Brijbhumi]|nr:filamentous hemagglutinin N-terminal domain-containing protein [Salmonella enterica subsp. enterica serovar Brijbhumi]
MNKIYKLIFDKRRGELVVVSEITAGLGKSGTTGQVVAPSSGSVRLGKLRPVTILIGSLLGMLPAHHVVARAATLLPTGGQIVVGQGNISSSGSTMTITQDSQKLGTNWNTFDIGQGNSVVFVQPGSSAVALNRVTGRGGASQIMGTLTANGQVFLLNPNGVLVGKTGQVNTAGFVASTQSISDSDFTGGNITLRSVGNGSIINQGNLTSTAGGYVVLSGGQVTNQGTITTPGGRTVMASADQVTLSLDGAGLTGVSVNGAVVNALVKNQGLIVADNGQVQLTARGQDMLLSEAVNNSGIIRAQGLSQQGGSIVLDGGNGGVVTQAGTLDVSSATVRGGKVVLEGQNIHLTGGSLINATGQTGGGAVNVDAAGRIEVTSTSINASGINLISNSSVGNGISILSSNLTVANGLNFTASNSAISINNSNINSSGESVLFGRAVTNSDWGGVTFRKTNVIVNSGNFTVDGILSCSTSYAGVYLASANLIVNNGAKVVLNGTQSVVGPGDSAGVKIGNPVYESGYNSISGCGSVNIYGVSIENYGINVDNSYSFRISGGVNVSFYGVSVSGTGFSQGSGSYQGFTYITDGSSVNISGASRSGSGVVYGASVGLDVSDDSSLVVSGTSTSGTGVALGAVNINNANISGISSSGVGVVISGGVGAGGSTSLTGSSAGSDGVSITGNVVGGAVSGSSE